MRDYVLGATLLNGRAEVLSFGGQVMKNVAGYDVSRAARRFDGHAGRDLRGVAEGAADGAGHGDAALRDGRRRRRLTRLNAWGGQPLPLHASAWWNGTLVLRLRGAAAAVRRGRARARRRASSTPRWRPRFWAGLRDQRDEFFVGALRAVEAAARAPVAPVGAADGAAARRCRASSSSNGAARSAGCAARRPPRPVREAAAAASAATPRCSARADKSAGAFAPLKPPLDRIHRELKRAFDPDGVFNPGRLMPGL